jgi:hypothetical protein
MQDAITMGSDAFFLLKNIQESVNELKKEVKELKTENENFKNQLTNAVAFAGTALKENIPEDWVTAGILGGAALLLVEHVGSGYVCTFLTGLGFAVTTVHMVTFGIGFVVIGGICYAYNNNTKMKINEKVATLEGYSPPIPRRGEN